MSTELATTDARMLDVLRSSQYPGAAPESVLMVLNYCRAAGLDPMQKPVHIVPMWDSKQGAMRDVIMPGIGLYRIQASRTGECAGISEPEFGPDVESTVGGQAITYPAWCSVTVRRVLKDGSVAMFAATERWLENYAIKGGKEKSTAPNAMWTKRPYGQLAKCAEAQALRKAFPELGAMPTAEEMEGKPLDLNERDMGAVEQVDPWSEDQQTEASEAAGKGIDAYQTWWKAQPEEFRRTATSTMRHADMKAKASAITNIAFDLAKAAEASA